MDFSIIIPSRNRPALMEEALRSVLAQDHSSKEIIIVNDGSDDVFLPQYEAITARYGAHINVVNLEKTLRGHGPSYAINRGAEQAQGEFLCFLDDDDSWSDIQHLGRAHSAITNNSAKVDLYISNQKAYIREQAVNECLWLESLAHTIQTHGRLDAQGAYGVTVDLLMTSSSFPHLNNTIVRRALFSSISGMDEGIRYECEWDLYFRIVDCAKGILYFPGFTSRHNVPNAVEKSNVSTAVSSTEKLRSRLSVMNKALLFTNQPSIQRAARKIKTYTIKRLAEELARQQRYRLAFHFACEALSLGFNMKWLGYCIYLGLRSTSSHEASCGLPNI